MSSGDGAPHDTQAETLPLFLCLPGYELGEDRELLLEKQLRGVELGWALGAGIAMLEKSTLTCTA